MALHALFASQILAPQGVIADGVVLVDDGTIRAAGARADMRVPSSTKVSELGDRILAPGFIDIHIHGGAGHDVMEAEPAALRAVARHLLRHGTTSFLPTTVSAPEPHLLRSLESLRRVLDARSYAGTEPLAEPLGIHLEGPFISAACRGAHAQADLQPPSLPLFDNFHAAAGQWLKIMTLAPELAGAAELQQHAQRAGVKIGIGHSNATYEQACAAIDAGASHGVHVFNAMRGFSHRDPGILGALLTDDRVMAELIADGVHVAPAAARLLLRAKGAALTMLITDAVSATGMGAGEFQLGAMEITVTPEPLSGQLACRNREGALAGSVLTQDAAVRHMISFTGASLGDALRMASANPARLLGMESRKGHLMPGADADLVILTREGAVTGAMVRGVLELF